MTHTNLSLALTALLALAGGADGQSAPAPPEARQFDFWIGEWDVKNLRLDPTGAWSEMGRAACKVYPILDGRAIVEHWRGVAWEGKTIGFSVRSFDPDEGRWVLLLSWPGPDRPGFGRLEGEFTHGRGEFLSRSTGPDGRTSITRYSFSDIRPAAMRWDAARSDDGGRTWSTNWIMEFTRRPAGALPLFHGPWIADGRERHCDQPEAAQLDFMAGGWEGVERSRARAGDRWVERRARASIFPILEGCAIMDFLEVEGDDGGYQRFGIRAWEAGRGAWTQYELDTLDGVFVRGSGAFRSGAIAFESAGDGAGTGPGRRVTWRLEDDGTLRRTDERGAGDGRSWTAVRELELRPTFYGSRETPRRGALRDLETALRDPDPSTLAARFDELRRARPEVDELLVNALGYQLLQQGRLELAIRAFQLNVETWPGSANVWDSLGEAYMTAGRREEAIEHYEKSLELDPGNTNATAMLEKLRE